MVDAKGKCFKCKKKTAVLNPGLICNECGNVFHGGCMIPPVEITELRDLAKSKWKCKKCFREDERKQFRKRANIEESNEIKREMDMIIEIKELLELSEMALDNLNEKYENLIRLNKYLKQENLVLSRRLAHLDGTYRLKVEFLSHITNKKPLTKSEYLENAIKLAQAQGKKEGEEEDVTKDFTTFAKFAGLNKGEIAAFEMQGRLRKYSKTWVTHVFLFLFLIAYTCIGGLIFHFIERSERPIEPANKNTLVDQYTPEMVNHLDQFKQQMTVAQSRDFHDQEFNILRDYEKSVRDRLNYEAKEQRGEDEMSWGYFSSVFFCSTVYTTIGYGHMYPTTDLSKIIVILYATIGVPLFLITLADFGTALTRVLKYLWNYIRRLHYTGSCRRKKRTELSKEAKSKFKEDDDFQLPISVALFIQFLYILLGSIIFNVWERWNHVDSFYFSFESVATIGYGDYVPQDVQVGKLFESSVYEEAIILTIILLQIYQFLFAPECLRIQIQNYVYMMPAMFYLLFGLAISSMTINVVREKILQTVDKASAKLGQTLEMYVDDIDDEMENQ